MYHAEWKYEGSVKCSYEKRAILLYEHYYIKNTRIPADYYHLLTTGI